MPSHCKIEFPWLSQEEMRIIDYGVMHSVFDVHNKLGRLADESVYGPQLANGLSKSGISSQLEVPVKLMFRDFSLLFLLDLVVDRQVIYELKTTTKLVPDHEAQLLNYLYMTNSARGKLVNFRTDSVTIQFVNTGYDFEKRRQFNFEHGTFEGSQTLNLLIREMVDDWGTGYSPSIYRRTILSVSDSALVSEIMLPMTLDGKTSGKQRFHLVAPNEGLGVTAYPRTNQDSPN